MVFSSMTFLFVFFVLCVIFYFLSSNRVWRNSVLLVFSLVFYSWGEPKFLCLLLLTTVVSYGGGLLLDRFQNSAGISKTVFVITVALLISSLLVFKYMNFFVENFKLLTGVQLPVPEVSLPIGISFYTFQLLSYVIDLYRKEIKVQKNLLYLMLYISFFPQLIAGPIVRYQTVEKEIRHRQESWEDVVAGLKRFIIGLAKKVILANNIAVVATIIYDGSRNIYGSAMYWLAAIAYTLQIYFDFSGYSDMAIGLGRIFGFHFLENFNHPYRALSVTDFWKRWHISLSSWFRDYVYIPLGGNRTSTGKWIRNILIVWCLTGFWHGAQWNFLLWGMYYAVLLLVEKRFLLRYQEKIPQIIRWAYTFGLVMVGWIIFNRGSLKEIIVGVGMLVVFRSTDWLGVVVSDAGILNSLIYIPLGILCLFPCPKTLSELFARDTVGWKVIANCGYLLLLGMSIVYILSSSYNPFIYFRF